MKAAFLRDGCQFWHAVGRHLAYVGYSELLVRTNAGGRAVSGEVSARFRRPDTQRHILAWIQGGIVVRPGMAHRWIPPVEDPWIEERPDQLGVIARWKEPPLSGPNTIMPILDSWRMAHALLTAVMDDGDAAHELMAHLHDQALLQRLRRCGDVQQACLPC